MQMTKHDPEKVLAAFYNEGWGYGFSEGREEGFEEGLETGREQGIMTVAQNALAKGSTPEFVQEITGLDIAVIDGLKR